MDQGKICVVGATTHPNLMTKPLLDRFVLQEELLAYEDSDLAQIVRQASHVEIAENACQGIARASMGTPRKALSLLASAGDLRLAKGENTITIALVEETLRRKRLDSLGLGPRHKQALEILKACKLPTGQARLAALMGLDRDVLQSNIQPDLIRLHLVDVTPRGLVASRKRSFPSIYGPNSCHEASQAKESITPYRKLRISGDISCSGTFAM